MIAEMKTAAYLCTGCGLGEALDIGQLERIAQKEGKMALVRRHEFLCSDAGVEVIRDDIANGAVTHVMIAGCSRRAKTEAFRFPTVAMARANLREGVVWVVAPVDEHDEVRQEMAADYVRMGCAEVRKMNVPAGNSSAATTRRVLVVGGGMSGLTAAIEAAETGYEVVVVEKEAALGGWAAKLWKRVPHQAPCAEPQDTGLADLVTRVTAHPSIAVHLRSTIAETAGAPGRFRVTIAQESGSSLRRLCGSGT
jgi:quinone-modifying oxidoreductase subunit QmoB